MADTIFVGGKTYLTTRSEGSQSTPGNYGTYASGGDDDYRVLVTTFNPNFKNNMIRIYTLGGGRSYAQVVPGKFEASGSFEYDVQNGDLFKYAYGSVTSGTQATKDLDGTEITGSPTAALKAYVVTESDTLDSFSMDITQISSQSAEDVRHRYAGVKINQLSLKADTENPLKATVDWLAQKPTTVVDSLSAPSTTSFDDVPKMFYQGQLLIGTGDYGANGTGTLNTMTDSSKSWTADQWNTNYILIDDTGMAFVITDNDATTLTVSGTPSSGAYFITPKSAYTSAQVIQCNSIDSTLTNNLEQYWSFTNDTGRGVRFLLEKQREYTLTLDMNFSNADQLGRFYDSTGSISDSGKSPTTTTEYTPFMIVVDYKTSTSDGDDYKGMRVVYDDVVFDEDSLPVDPMDILKQTITAYAKRSAIFYITNETQTA